MKKISYEQIEEFYKQKRVAIIGLSRKEKTYSRGLFTELKKRDYEIIPVNPNAEEIDGIACVADISKIDPAPSAAYILTTTRSIDSLVDECMSKGIKHIWYYTGKDKSESLWKISENCQRHGINFIFGQCPFMFLKDTSFPHKFHGFIMKLMGQYPV
ncbi:MAG: CoA-binding protein [Methanococcaceae archaeon]